MNQAILAISSAVDGVATFQMGSWTVGGWFIDRTCDYKFIVASK